MAKFFIGQRVRVKWFRYSFDRPNTEGRIVEIGNWSPGESHDGYWMTFVESAECIVHMADDVLGAFLFDQLEPIIPEGHRAGEEGTCEPLDKLLSEVSREAAL